MRLGTATWLLLAWLLAAGLAGAAPERMAADTGAVVLAEIEGGIGPATRDHLGRAIERAKARGAPALVLRINTPGGLDASTRDINAMILASPVPVIGWVAPEGARAASAGTYILYATHLAAMAPATAMGAATPVAIGGAGPPGGKESPRQDEGGAGQESNNPESGGERERPPEGQRPATRGDTDDAGAMGRKAVNDAVAYLRSLAELRGRDERFAEEAVRDAATLTARQAHERGVVELIATDLDSLLSQADGRKVRLRTGTVVLATAGREVERFEPDWRTRLLSVITEPTVAYLLLLVGIYGLAFEGYSPGAIVPGVVGAISLLLALYALQVLPVNYAGVALIALGVLLMIAELAMPSVGALGIGGVVALVVGSVILFDTEIPGFGVPVALIAGIGAASAGGFLAALWFAARARRRPVITGVDELVGHRAIALGDFRDDGRVHVRGEVWQARSDTAVQRGQPVRVLAVEGLVLHVIPETEPAHSGTARVEPQPGGASR